MYTTSLKTWARALTIDTVLIGALVAGFFFNVPYALAVSVFFIWWLCVLGIFAQGAVFLVISSSDSEIKKLKLRLESQKTAGLEGSALHAETLASLAKVERLYESVWTNKLVKKLACSNTFLVYHWVSDVFLVSVLVIAGHPVLASFKTMSFLLSLMLISNARKDFRTANGLQTEDDLEADFAARRAEIHQSNNVVGGDFAGGNTIKTK